MTTTVGSPGPASSPILGTFEIGPSLKTLTEKMELVFNEKLEPLLNTHFYLRKLYSMAGGDAFKNCFLAYARAKDDFNAKIGQVQTEKEFEELAQGYQETYKEKDCLTLKLNAALENPEKAFEKFIAKLGPINRMIANTAYGSIKPIVNELIGPARDLVCALDQIN